MNRLFSIVADFGRKFVEIVRAWWPGGYEGARRWNPDRGFIPGMPTDARFDADQLTRLELLHKARFFERNNAIVNRLADLFEQFTVGPNGLQILPDSTDENWNQAAKAWWDNWCQSCDLTSLANFGTIQSLVARSWFVDGEIFIRKTYEAVSPADRRSGKPIYRPRLQLIEGHRIGTPGAMASLEGVSIIDGKEVDKNGRATAYWYRDGTGYESSHTFTRIPASEMIHVYEPSRAGMPRGLTFLYPIINDINDLDDLQILEMRAAKDAAEKSTFFTTASGELNRDEFVAKKIGIITRTDTTGKNTLEDRVLAIRQVMGGRSFALGPGEDVKQFVPGRPSVTTREYWDYLTSKVCAGVGISQLLVFPRSMQGTVARAELDIANAFFRARSAILANAFRQIYEWVISWAVDFEPALDGAPADGSYIFCSMRPPRAVNVDVGRNSSAMLAELAAGARTYESVYSETGQDWRREFRQCAKETAYFMQCCKDENVEPVMVRTAISAALQVQVQQDALERQEEDNTDGSELTPEETSKEDA